MKRPTSDLVKKKDGFTLVETLVALVIFSVAMIAVLTMCLTSIRTNSFSHRMTEARFLAQGKLEEFLNVVNVSSLVAGDETVAGNGEYQRSWSFDDGPGGARWTTVTVAWDDEKGGHTVAVSSLVRGSGI